MARPANIVCEPNGYLSFYSGAIGPKNLVTKGNSPQHHALARNVLQNSDNIEVTENNESRVLTIKGQRRA